MLSTNDQCPLPFNKLLYHAAQQQSSQSSQSDISSIGSDWSDIRSIALQLGITNPDELVNERFKVDRQKLESKIKGMEFFTFAVIAVPANRELEVFNLRFSLFTVLTDVDGGTAASEFFKTVNF